MLHNKPSSDSLPKPDQRNAFRDPDPLFVDESGEAGRKRQFLHQFPALRHG
jgi:hypothetical protein